MKNKGFTLIELLAVIVILAIIALIATPVILGIIDDTRTQAKERSAELVISSVETAYATAFMKSYTGGTSAGVAPKLSEVKSELDFKNMDATDTKIETDGVTLSVVTTDDITCTFKVEENELTIATNGCGEALTLDAKMNLGTITAEG